MTAPAGGSRADGPLVKGLAEPTYVPLGSAKTVETACGCAGGQGRTPERVARDGWGIGWLLLAYVAGALTALGVTCGSLIGWAS